MENEVLAIVDRKTHRASLHSFIRSNGLVGLPTIELSQSFEAKDNDEVANNIIFVMLSEGGELSLFHPLLNIRFPPIHLSPVLSLESCSGSLIEVSNTQGEFAIQITLEPATEMVKEMLPVAGTIIRSIVVSIPKVYFGQCNMCM